MNLEQRKKIVRNLMLSLWAMLTLVLLFCVVLLVREMIQNGTDPLARLAPETTEQFDSAVSKSDSPDDEITTKETLLYFVDPARTGLSGELRLLEHTDSTLENCRIALHALIEGPRENTLALLPEEVQIRALYLLDGGELVIDFSREMLQGAQVAEDVYLEALMVYSLINTLSHPSLTGHDGIRVRSMRFLLEGSTPEDIFPAHLDLTNPIHPDPRWAIESERQSGHG